MTSTTSPHLDNAVSLSLRAGLGIHEAISLFRRELIVAALRENGGNLCRTARQLQIHRNNLSSDVRRFKIKVVRNGKVRQ